MLPSSDRSLPTILLNAIIDGDDETVRRTLADDVVWHTPPSTLPDYQGPHRGPTAVIALTSGSAGVFRAGTRSVEVLRQVAEGDLIAVDWRHNALMADGSPYQNLYSFFFRIADGLVAEVWENFDTGYLYQRLGLMPDHAR